MFGSTPKPVVFGKRNSTATDRRELGRLKGLLAGTVESTNAGKCAAYVLRQRINEIEARMDGRSTRDVVRQWMGSNTVKAIAIGLILGSTFATIVTTDQRHTTVTRSAAR